MDTSYNFPAFKVSKTVAPQVICWPTAWMLGKKRGLEAQGFQAQLYRVAYGSYGPPLEK